MARPFRFAIQAKNTTDAKAWAEQARKVEDLGYSTLTLPDHFDGQLAPTLALQAAADATNTLNVGALVWCNDYRHPVVFASEMATLDILSEGRVEMGIGAGWMKTDYDAAGMSYDRPGVRIDRMQESVEIIRGLHADGAYSFSGEHYTITDLDLMPKPVQRPIPLLIGGGGPRMLRYAGRVADIVGINPNLKSGAIDATTSADTTAERFTEKLGWVRDGAGDRFDDIELQVRVFFVVFTDDKQGTLDAMAPGLGLTPEQAAGSPLALVGTAEQMIEDLQARREQFGFSYVTVGPDEIDQFAPVVAALAGT